MSCVPPLPTSRILLACVLFGIAASHAAPSLPPSVVRTAPAAGEMILRRREVWALLASWTHTTGDHAQPAFESWHGEDAVFSRSGLANERGIRGFSRHAARDDSSAAVPVISYALYNHAAFAHIRAHRLESRAELARLQAHGIRAPEQRTDRSIPGFPDGAVILKTAWWPLAADRFTALPVWDPEMNPAQRSGNSYLSWRRIVGVAPSALAGPSFGGALDFAGRSFAPVHEVGVDALYTVAVDDKLAARLMRDPTSRKAALIALGRELAAGDYLALVSLNMAARERGNWLWAAFWWHDRPEAGRNAGERPPELREPWRHYLLQVAFDSDVPAAADGGPAVCFDPWLEGRFPDGGHGSGLVSNCVTCHRRASFPAIDFLPVTRGAADPAVDPAFAPGRLRTDQIWSIALHAQP